MVDDDDRNRGDRDDRGRHRGNCNRDDGNGNGYGGDGRYGRGNASVSGVITGINGNEVIVHQGLLSALTIDDQPALDNRRTGRVYVGRTITAYGYWRNNVFFATSIQ